MQYKAKREPRKDHGRCVQKTLKESTGDNLLKIIC